MTNGYGTKGAALQVHDAGTGSGLYFGGSVTALGPIASHCVARWGPLTPGLELAQVAGPGTGSFVRNRFLLKGHEYYNIFSDALCGPPGAGPYLGLCAPDPTFLVNQFLLPVGTPPIHFIAPVGAMESAAYALPAGMVPDAICFDFTGGVLGCVSEVARITVQ